MTFSFKLRILFSFLLIFERLSDMTLLRLFVKTFEGENISVDASDIDCIQDVKDYLYV